MSYADWVVGCRGVTAFERLSETISNGKLYSIEYKTEQENYEALYAKIQDVK